ncbi:MAG: ATP-binding protein [Eubacteriales bacterium]|nr:ATP-binding protein [Eubacteriales bacterium]
MTLSELMDTPRLYTALAEWGACLVYIFLLRRRFQGIRLGASLAGGLLVFAAYQTIAGLLPLWFWIPCMAGALLLMYLFLTFACRESRPLLLDCCLHAFVLAEFTASLQWQLYVWAETNFHVGQIWSVLLMLLLYPSALFLFYRLERSHFVQRDPAEETDVRELTVSALIALCSFSLGNLSFAAPNTPFSTAASSILYVRTLVDFCGLVMLYALQDRREELRMRSENQAMNGILQRQYDQYRLSVDNIELLRREFHDLKHYMIAIRAEQDPAKKEQYLLEMEEAILTQEALSNTGNNVLDVLLTTKSTYCLQNDIHFTCMADGNLVAFLHVKDICSIFGNMLDNAIECVSRFSDPEKRLITLTVRRQNRFLVIQCENYTDTELSLTQGQLPLTTKTDKAYHGYGLKSIRHAAQKYGGTMTLQTRENWFTLQILIPIP